MISQSKKILYLLSLLTVYFIFLNIEIAEANDDVLQQESVVTISPFSNEQGGGGTSYYPGTNVPIKIGDILLSTNLSLDTFFVGHAGIIGPDNYVYEVTKGSKGARTSLTNYIAKHKTANLLVHRTSTATNAAKAGSYAAKNYTKVQSYLALDGNLYDITTSYCSEFVWNAYYAGAGVSIPGIISVANSSVAYGITPAGLATNTGFVVKLK